MTFATATQISAAKTAELVAFYNAHFSDKQIKKFADRATAEKRCLALLPKKAPKTAMAALAETVTKAAPKAAPKAAAAPSEAATRPYRIVDLSIVKRGAIHAVCAALAGRTFTREEFEAEVAKHAAVRARSHFYWAKAHGVLAAAVGESF